MSELDPTAVAGHAEVRSSPRDPTMAVEERRRGPGKPRKDGQRRTNPLQRGIEDFLLARQQDPRGGAEEVEEATTALPKRYTLYPPLLLLPANFSTASPKWQAIYADLNAQERAALFCSIAIAFRPQEITHIAFNAPISREDASTGELNLMRRPSGLIPIYGDFGPAAILPRGDDQVSQQPRAADFGAAFWVSAVQNGHIVQVWAPLWTMFSRGNIGEKARILGDGGGRFEGLSEQSLGQKLDEIDVIDFYCGIGYFAFSYLRRGVRMVWGWEINGWSVEGLRKGAEKNDWETLVVPVSDEGELAGNDMALLIQKVCDDKNKLRCVVFDGDNRWANQVMARLGKKILEKHTKARLNIRHANLGLLPTSSASWEDAVSCLDEERGGWLHVHENVDDQAILMKRDEIVKQIATIVKEQRGSSWRISCCHVEHVKTYAPRVMHCVFDIQILPER